jgi:hypothetical protein
MLRLNLEAHPLEYVNDGDANSIWISDFMNQVNLVVDLGDEFQARIFILLISQYFLILIKALESLKEPDQSVNHFSLTRYYTLCCTTHFHIDILNFENRQL